MKKELFLDRYFEGKSLKENIILFLIVASAITFLMFYIFFPKIYKLEKKEKTSLQHNEKTLKELKVKKKAFNAQTKVLTNIIAKTEKENKILTNQNMFFKDILNTLDIIVFKDKNWINYVQNIVKNANKKGLKILSLNTVHFDKDKNLTKNNKPVVKKMEININLKGNFLNLLSYMYDYEKNKNLLKIENFNISEDNNYSLKISIYGERK
jgi:ribosomal protein L22